MKPLRLLNHLQAVTLCCLWTMSTMAQNPVIHNRYTPDPAPYVHGDTLYLFVDHDENETLNGYFTMKDWLLYSTVDMVNLQPSRHGPSRTTTAGPASALSATANGIGT